MKKRNFYRGIYTLVVTAMVVMPLTPVLAAPRPMAVISENSVSQVAEPEVVTPQVEAVPAEISAEPAQPADDAALIDMGLQADVEPNDTETITEEIYPFDSKSQPTQHLLKARVEDSSGAFVYSVPIDVPKGRNNIQPDLSFTYNSQSRDRTLLGQGWSMSQLNIGRSPKTGIDKMYTDNNFTSVLDGDLVPVELSDGVHGTYSSLVENGDFRKYEFFTDGHWDVVDKAGTVYYFGLTSDSRQDDPIDSSKIYKWMLSRIEDQNGNYADYHYVKNQGQIYPSDIQYTGNGSELPLFEVDFNLETRPDLFSDNGAGFLATTTNRVSSVLIKEDGSPVKEYDINYSNGSINKISLVTSITEKVYKNDVPYTKPALTFDYQQATTTWTVDPVGYSDLPVRFADAGGATPTRIAEVNGDGIPDFINGQCGTTTRVYLSNNDGSGWTIHDDFHATFCFMAGSSDAGVRVADVNGDGFDDIVKAIGNSNYFYTNVYINRGDNTGWDNDANYVVPFAFVWVDATTDVTEGDVNGDGLPDYLTRESNYAGKVFINKGDGTGWEYDSNYVIPVPLVQSGHDLGVRLVDVNGDGLTDIIQAYEFQPRKVFINKGDGTGWEYDSNYIVPVDFISTFNSRDMGVRFADINSDGLVDIVRATTNYYNAYINKGDGTGWQLDSSYVPRAPFVNDSTGKDLGGRLFDINGDGVPDFLVGYNQNPALIKMKSPEKDNLLIALHEPAGLDVLVVYQSSHDASQTGSNLNAEISFPLQTVKSISLDSGIGEPEVTSYSFQDGSFYFNNSFDKKFAGFGKVVLENDDKKVISYYSQGNASDTSLGEVEDNVFKIGKKYRQEVYDSYTGQKESQKINRWESHDLGNGNGFVFSSSSIDVLYENNNAAEIRGQFEAYDLSNGNILEQGDLGLVTADPETGVVTDYNIGDEKTTTYSYALNADKHILGAPKTKVISGLSETKDQDYYYDQLPLGQVNKVNLTKEDTKVNGVDVETTYNNLGLPETKKDPKENTVVTLAYDSANLYPQTSTDVNGRITTTEYDPVTGQLLHSTDPNGYQQSNDYDAFGRPILKQVSDPNNPANLITVQEISYEDVAFPNYREVKDYYDPGQYVTSREYYDGLGRVIQSKKSDASGQYVTVAMEYDSQGRVKKQSLPYFSGSIAYSAPVFTYSKQYTYDVLDRVLTEITPVGTTTYAYDGFTTTITDPRGKVKELTKDAYDNLVLVKEHEGAAIYTTNYEYTLTNKLKKITDAQGNIRNFVYDDLDNLVSQDMVHKTSVVDPVDWVYTYDNNGNVLTKTDPRNQATDYTYDSLNRILTEDFSGISGVEYDYNYDEGLGQLNRLSSVIGNNDSATYYSYDYAGKPTLVHRVVDGLNFDLRYDYNLRGDVRSITYPEGQHIIYSFNNAGQVNQVDLVDEAVTTTLATNIQYSLTGLISHLERGNGVTTDYTYDPAQGYRLTHLVSQLGSVKLQDISYTYDDNGNILTLTDNSNTDLAKTVTYNYDDLNRLVSATVTNAASGNNYSHTYSYDAIGNMLSNSAVGQYTYNKDNPHQAGQIGADYYTYDANGNVRYINNDLHEWDWRDRMSRSRLSNNDSTYYVYDHNNQRLKKWTDVTVVTPPPPVPCRDECPTPIFEGSVDVGIEATTTEEIIAKPPENDIILEELLENGEVGSEEVGSEDSGTGVSEVETGEQPVKEEIVEEIPELDPLAISQFPNPGIITMASVPEADDVADYYIDKYYESRYNGSARNHYFLGNVRLASEKLSGDNAGIYYFLSDHLGSSSLTTNATGTVIALTDYYPYGSESYNNATTDIGDDYTFTGKEADEESDLQYFGARYYDQESGRWISIDPYSFQLNKITKVLTDPQSLNAYLYTRGNPVILIDPDGREYVYYGNNALGAFSQGIDAVFTSIGKESPLLSSLLPQQYGGPGSWNSDMMDMSTNMTKRISGEPYDETAIARGTERSIFAVTGVEEIKAVQATKELTFGARAVGEVARAKFDEFKGLSKYIKHVVKEGDFGGMLNTSFRDYGKMFDDVWSGAGNILEKVREGKIMRYEIDKNIFTSIGSDGSFKTLFQPEDGLGYWFKQ